MSERQALRRLRAFHAGRPLPRGETKPLRLAEDRNILILSFVRMGGESRPWGIAFGQPGKTPKRIFSVPEARNRDLVAAMVLNLAPHLLKHIQFPGLTSPPPDTWEDLQPVTQVWLANSTHLDMLHHLGYAYSWTKFGEKDRPTLNALGRATGWLFREGQRPGQMQVMVATQALRDLYTFPSEDNRQGHLGFLLAWLNTKGGYDRRLEAALAAETESIATSLDPDVERKTLQPLLETWGEADKNGQERAKKQAENEMHSVLAEELERRWRLTEQAIITIRDDPRRTNSGVEALVTESLKERWFQYVRLELNQNDENDGPAFFPSVETDRHPAAAAARYNIYQASAELMEAVLIHDDRELLAEAIDAGDAIEGEIIEVEDIGAGRKTRPIWYVRDNIPRQLRLRVGSRVAAHGFRPRDGRIVSMDQEEDGSLVPFAESKPFETIGFGSISQTTVEVEFGIAGLFTQVETTNTAFSFGDAGVGSTLTLNQTLGAGATLPAGITLSAVGYVNQPGDIMFDTSGTQTVKIEEPNGQTAEEAAQVPFEVTASDFSLTQVFVIRSENTVPSGVAVGDASTFVTLEPATLSIWAGLAVAGGLGVFGSRRRPRNK